MYNLNATYVPLICFALSVGSTCPWVCKQYGSIELLFSTVHAEYERCSGSQSVGVVFYQCGITAVLYCPNIRVTGHHDLTTQVVPPRS